MPPSVPLKVVKIISLPSRSNLGEIKSPIRINPFIRWNGSLWIVIRSDGPTPIVFYNLATGEQKTPTPLIYETVGNGYLETKVLSNGNLSLWIGARTKPAGDYYILDTNFNVLSHTSATGSGTQGMGSVNGLGTICNYVNEFKAAQCTHDLQLFQGRADGTVASGPVITLPQGHSTCITVFSPQVAMVTGADGKVYIGAIRDSNGHGFADFLRLNPTTMSLEKHWPSWKAVGAEIPPIHACRSGGKIVFSTTNDEPITSVPFNLAKHPMLLIGDTPDLLTEFVNKNVWVGVYNDEYVTANANGDTLVASSVYNPATGSQLDLLNIWRLRNGQYELCYSANIGSNGNSLGFRGIYTEGNDIWITYGQPDNTCVAIQLSDPVVVEVNASSSSSDPSFPILRETVNFPVATWTVGGVPTPQPALPMAGQPLFEFNGDTWCMLQGGDFQGDAFNLRTQERKYFKQPDGVFQPYHSLRNSGPVFVYPTATGFIIAKGNLNAWATSSLSILGTHLYFFDTTGAWVSGGNISPLLLLDSKRYGDAVYLLYGGCRSQDPQPRAADIWITRVDVNTSAVTTQHYLLPPGESSNLPPILGSLGMVGTDICGFICRDSNHVCDVVRADAATLALKQFHMQWLVVGGDMPTIQVGNVGSKAMVTLTRGLMGTEPFQHYWLEQVPGVRWLDGLAGIGEVTYLPNARIPNGHVLPMTVDSSGQVRMFGHTYRVEDPKLNATVNPTGLTVWRWNGTGFEVLHQTACAPAATSWFLPGGMSKDWLAYQGLDGVGVAKRFA